MKYAVSFVYNGEELRSVVFFDSLQLAVEYIKSSIRSYDSAVVYEIKSRLTCKYLDNKLFIS